MYLTVLTGLRYYQYHSSACGLEIAALGGSTLRTAVFFLVPLFAIHAAHSFNLVATHSQSNLHLQQSRAGQLLYLSTFC